MVRLIIYDDTKGKEKIMCLQTCDITMISDQPELYYDNEIIENFIGRYTLSLTVYPDNTEFAEMLGLVKFDKKYRIKRFFKKIVEKTRLYFSI